MHRIIINLIYFTKRLQDINFNNGMKTLKKTLRIIIFISIYYPIIDLGIIYSFVLRTTFTLARFPKYNDPDPKELGFDEHYSFVYSYYLEFIPYCILIVLIYVIICLIKKINLLSIKLLHFIFFSTLIIVELLTIISFGGWFVD